MTRSLRSTPRPEILCLAILWLALPWFVGAIGGIGGVACGADTLAAARERMVVEDIARGGVADQRVLASMRATLRHEFVPSPQRQLAYYDIALPIGGKQTISAPFVVAFMTEKLEPKPTDRVLEIGTGSGYQAAVLSPLVKTVYSIEIDEDLGRRAARTLSRLGYKNVVTRVGDGFLGWPEEAPFDKIIVTCSPEAIPKPLEEQLAEGGRMIIPVGERYEQSLVLLTKREGRLEKESLVPSLFVPMTGEAEAKRQVLPDGAAPQLRNGSFEETVEEGALPSVWYYGRQASAPECDEARDGRRVLRLDNSEPGRPSQIFQGFPVDGRRVGRLKVAIDVRGEMIRPGRFVDEVPGVWIQFFDASRARSSRVRFGDWQGTFEWRRAEHEFVVPPWATEAIMQVGLIGATGRMEADAVRLEGILRPEAAEKPAGSR